MSSKAPSLEELIAGLPNKSPDTPGGGGGAQGASVATKPARTNRADEEEENLDDVEETIVERLVGLTEMVPDPVWNVGEKTLWWSVWLVRRSAWVLGTSLALLALPPFIEQQRIEFEEMQNMQKKQLMLGQGAPGAFPPPPR